MASPDPKKPARILFVDDEAELATLIRTKFRKKIKAGEFDLSFASNGVEALEKLQTQPQFDLVITDLNMPQMDGLTLLEKIQDMTSEVKMFVLVLTAYDDLQNIRTAMNRGAFDFLTKPINFQDLEITMGRALNLVRNLRENQEKLQEAQTQIMQQEKMSALGHLVAGIAHEINNPLGYITGNLEITQDYIQDLLALISLYQQQIPDPGELINHKIADIDLNDLKAELPTVLHAMKVGTDRILEISKSLRTFSRSDTEKKVACDIHDGINSTLLILKHRLKANRKRPAIEIVKNYGDLPPVRCYLGQLNQVFMNIFANAIDALEEYWQQLETTPPHLPTIWIQTEPLEPQSISIRIRDNGQGIPDAVQARIFERLFTTKPVGVGTGLGLSICNQIVTQAHGGNLSFTSHWGKGTEFLIEIPT